MNQYKHQLATSVAATLMELFGDVEGAPDAAALADWIEYPPNAELGDFSFPCFRLSKIYRKSPAQIADQLRDAIAPHDILQTIVSVSGYVNFYLDKQTFAVEAVRNILEAQESFGSSQVGAGKQVVIDYSSPNIAKPFHVGHLRSTSIGRSLYNLLSFIGYRCIGVNHLGDWGTQFGKLIVAYKMWGNEDEVNAGGVKELMRLYVKFHDELESNPTLEDVARAWFVNLEEGDSEAMYLWKWFRDISLDEFKRIYDLMNVSFDSYAGESFYNDKMGRVINELLACGLLKEDEGAQIVDLEAHGMAPCLILKSDGSSLYATRDIAAALYRKEKYEAEKIIYVTGATQSLHFQQWFKVVELMGYGWGATDLYHVPFGQVSLEGAKIATRKGNVVLLEDIFAQAIAKTADIIEEKNPGLENKEEVARQVGVGAIVFNDLSTNRIKDVVFSWSEVLNFDGETGPYVQYTYARASSIIRKAEEQSLARADRLLDGLQSDCLLDEAAFQLLKQLQLFPEKVLLACEKLEPSLVARYLVDVAQSFNRFYHDCPILKVEDIHLRQARLAVVECSRTVLVNGLRLIGLDAPERI